MLVGHGRPVCAMVLMGRVLISMGAVMSGEALFAGDGASASTAVSRCRQSRLAQQSMVELD